MPIADLSTEIGANTNIVFMTPERELIAAVLWTAVNDAMLMPDHTGTNNILKTKALEWLFAEEKEHAARPWSFVWICDVLGLDAPRLLEGIKEVIKGDRRHITYLKTAQFV